MSLLDDQIHMRAAIALARANLGLTEPNPAVGCVIVRHGAVVGEGATGEGGRPHAEEVALDQAREAARGATAYVTLEPCAQRTSGAASCSQRLVAAGVSRVVIACEDPSAYAAGAGVVRLRAAGVETEVGFLAQEANLLYVGYAPSRLNPRDS